MVVNKYYTTGTDEYTFVSTTAGATTTTSDMTADMWSTIRVPKLNTESWTHVERPEPGGVIKSAHIIESIENLRKEFDTKLESMMNQMMENLIKMVALLPRNGGEIPMREGVLCICGNFIPEDRKLERCEYCGK